MAGLEPAIQAMVPFGVMVEMTSRCEPSNDLPVRTLDGRFKPAHDE